MIKQIYQEWKERRKARIEECRNWMPEPYRITPEELEEINQLLEEMDKMGWSNKAEEGQGGGEAPGRSPSLDAQGADTLVTRVSGCSSLRPLQGGGNMGQGISPL